MKLILIVALSIAACLAAPAEDHAQILRYENEQSEDHSYNFAFDTSDGISRQEQAELKNVGAEDEAMVVRGSFSYTGDDGIVYTINYIADENGFRPQGAHLPVAPEA